MKDALMIYLFLALMVFNLLASFVYVFGFAGLKPALKKSLKPLKRR